MPADTPTSREVAEAKVYPRGANEFAVHIMDGNNLLFLLSKDQTWRRTEERFASRDAARSALAAAQERAGVYARPDGAVCSCVVLLFKTCEGWQPRCALTPIDRPWAWCWNESCCLCSRGVPLKAKPVGEFTIIEPAEPDKELFMRVGVTPAAPGGEGKDTADPNYKPPESDLNCDCDSPSPVPRCNECGDRLPQYEVIPAAELEEPRRVADENYTDLMEQMDEAWGQTGSPARCEINAFVASRVVHKPTRKLRDQIIDRTPSPALAEVLAVCDKVANDGPWAFDMRAALAALRAGEEKKG